MRNYELKEVEDMQNLIKELNKQLEQKDKELEDYKKEENNIKNGFLAEISMLRNKNSELKVQLNDLLIKDSMQNN